MFVILYKFMFFSYRKENLFLLCKVFITDKFKRIREIMMTQYFLRLTLKKTETEIK